MKGLIEKIRTVLGADHKALADELATAVQEALDAADESAAKATEAAKALKAAETKAAKLERDLAAKSGSESEELAKLKAERDGLTARLEESTAAVGKARLEYALRDAAREAGMRDLDGLKMLDTTGVSIDDAGKLVGAEKLFKAAKESKPYLFDAPGTTAGQPTQPGTGAAPRPGDNRGGGQPAANKVDELAKLIAQPAGAPKAASAWGPQVASTVPTGTNLGAAQGMGIPQA